MNSESFECTLRAFRRRIPFRTFIVEMTNGTRFEVDCPEAFAFNGGGAAYIPPNGDLELLDHLNVSQLIEA